MRKSLFRGRDHAGKWHKGNKFSGLEENPDTDTEMFRLAYYIQNDAGEEHEVVRETIIQLVCPATEEEPEIWEGDIIEDKDYRMVVTFSDSSQMFYLLAHSKTSAEYKPLNMYYLEFRLKDGRAKVVGNIHDTLKPTTIKDNAIKILEDELKRAEIRRGIAFQACYEADTTERFFRRQLEAAVQNNEPKEVIDKMNGDLERVSAITKEAKAMVDEADERYRIALQSIYDTREAITPLKNLRQ